MKRLLLFLVASLSMSAIFAQPSGMLNETFNLKYLRVGDIYYTPNGENPNLTITENSGNYSFEAGGIFNMLSGSAIFNGDIMTLDSMGVTLHNCVEPNCYYEDLYFYGVLTTNNMESKTLTYNYNENNGFRYLTLTDGDNNIASYSTAPNEEPNSLLFQTWYLYMTVGDMGLDPPTHYTGPNPPQITINPELTYVGIEDCALVGGDLIFGEAWYDEFILQPRNYVVDESDCTTGPPTYAMPELEVGAPLTSKVYEGSDSIDYLEYYTGEGVISYFRNVLILSVPENEIISGTVFPNPAQDKIFIKTDKDDVDSVSIMDINGRTVIFEEDKNLKEVDVSELKSGMYFIVIESSLGNVTKKFIKE